MALAAIKYRGKFRVHRTVRMGRVCLTLIRCIKIDARGRDMRMAHL